MQKVQNAAKIWIQDLVYDTDQAQKLVNSS